MFESLSSAYSDILNIRIRHRFFNISENVLFLSLGHCTNKIIEDAFRSLPQAAYKSEDEIQLTSDWSKTESFSKITNNVFMWIVQNLHKLYIIVTKFQIWVCTADYSYKSGEFLQSKWCKLKLSLYLPWRHTGRVEVLRTAPVIFHICFRWRKVDSRPGCSTSEKRAQLPTEEVIERAPETVQNTCRKEIPCLCS